jgi:hypothetical protein
MSGPEHHLRLSESENHPRTLLVLVRSMRLLCITQDASFLAQSASYGGFKAQHSGA